MLVGQLFGKAIKSVESNLIISLGFARLSISIELKVSSYEEVIPMDILVTQLLKALVVSDIEMAIDLGMLELVPEDLALCSYVCPSKYDYSSILMDNLNKLYLES